MKINLENIGKKFSKTWIFKNLNVQIEENDALVILGANGSGKSTLLQIISGLTLPTEGQVTYESKGLQIGSEEIYKEVSWAAPYLELLETLTLDEILKVHFQFKKPKAGIGMDDFFQTTYLQEHRNKLFADLSSGMKQRVKLGLAILSDTKLLLLDEPLINLDDRGKNMYFELMEKFKNDRTVVVCSNHQKQEFDFCNKTLNLSQQ